MKIMKNKRYVINPNGIEKNTNLDEGELVKKLFEKFRDSMPTINIREVSKKAIPVFLASLLTLRSCVPAPIYDWIFPNYNPVPTYIPTAQPTAVPTKKPIAKPTAKPTKVSVINNTNISYPENTVYCLINLFGDNISDIKNTKENRNIVENQLWFLEIGAKKHINWYQIPQDGFGFEDSKNYGKSITDKLFDSPILKDGKQLGIIFSGEGIQQKLLKNLQNYPDITNVVFVGTDTPKSKENLASFVDLLYKEKYNVFVGENLFIGIPKEKKEDWKKKGILYNTSAEIIDILKS